MSKLESNGRARVMDTAGQTLTSISASKTRLLIRDEASNWSMLGLRILNENSALLKLSHPQSLPYKTDDMTVSNSEGVWILLGTQQFLSILTNLRRLMDSIVVTLVKLRKKGEFQRVFTIWVLLQVALKFLRTSKLLKEMGENLNLRAAK